MVYGVEKFPVLVLRSQRTPKAGVFVFSLMSELKDFKLSQIQECKNGGIIFPLEFDSIEDLGVRISQLISTLHLIVTHGDSLNHLSIEDI